jgi:hypothetical protein
VAVLATFHRLTLSSCPLRADVALQLVIREKGKGKREKGKIRPNSACLKFL